MSNHPQQNAQQPMTTQEIRECLLSELESSKRALQELSDEELTEVVGGLGFSGAVKGFKMAGAYGGNILAKVKSGVHGLSNEEKSTWKYAMGQAATHPSK